MAVTLTEEQRVSMGLIAWVAKNRGVGAGWLDDADRGRRRVPTNAGEHVTTDLTTDAVSVAMTRAGVAPDVAGKVLDILEDPKPMQVLFTPLVWLTRQENAGNLDEAFVVTDVDWAQSFQYTHDPSTLSDDTDNDFGAGDWLDLLFDGGEPWVKLRRVADHMEAAHIKETG